MNLFQKAQKLQKTKIINCLICNSKFEPKLSDLERGWGMFCSKTCSASWRNKVKYKKVTKQEIREYKIRKLGISQSSL